MEIIFSNHIPVDIKRTLEKKIEDILFNLVQQNMLEEVLKPDKCGNVKFEMQFKETDVIVKSDITQIKSYFLNTTTSE